jgi:hypothetical protein
VADLEVVVLVARMHQEVQQHIQPVLVEVEEDGLLQTQAATVVPV